MNSTGKGLFILIALASLGLWGCSQNQDGTTDAKLRELEARHVKLEEDYQAVVAANDNIRKRLATVEAQRADLAKKVEGLQLVVRERDELRHQLVTRTGERDAIHSQLVQFSKELHGLAGRIEAATNSNARPETTALADQD
jgi:hypothetical protein